MSKFLSPSLVLIILISSCVSNGKFAALDKEHENLQRMLAKTQTELYQVEEDKAQLKISQRQLIEEVQEVKAHLRSTENQVESLKIEIESKSQIIELLSTDVSTAPDVIGFLEEEPLEYIDRGFLNHAHPVNIVNEINDFDHLSNDQSINFFSGSDRVNDVDRASLELIAQQFLANPHVHFLIEGHSDHRRLKSTARFKDNWDLSKKRSEAVAQVLISFGVNPNQFTVIGKSDTEPLIRGDHLNEDDLAKNRRVEIIAQVNSNIQQGPASSISPIGVSIS